MPVFYALKPEIAETTELRIHLENSRLIFNPSHENQFKAILFINKMRINFMSDQTQDRAKALAEFYGAPDDALFGQDVIALVRGCSTATMERDRWAGTGIQFIKVNRAVRYRKSDALAWLAKCQTLNSTSEVTVDTKPVVAVEPKKVGIYPKSGRLKAKGKVKTLDAVEKAAVKHVAGV